ncbi:MAG: ATP-binding protein [Floccifex sp.]
MKELTIDKLEDFGILCKVGNQLYPTHAFTLLTQPKEKYVKIQCGLFKGTTRISFLDRKEYYGPIYKQLEDAFLFIKRHLNMQTAVNGLGRTDIYELPILGIREILANAVCHRSYIDESSIQVSIYDDRLEVLSPGTLYGGLDVQSAIHGKSKCRNTALAEAFQYMKIIESWGTGLPKLFQLCREYGLKEPLFEEFGNNVRVVVYRNNKGIDFKTNIFIKNTNDLESDANELMKNANDLESDANELMEDIYDLNNNEFQLVNKISKLKINKKRKQNILKIIEHFSDGRSFQRKDIVNLGICENTAASSLISVMKKYNFIEISEDKKRSYKIHQDYL